MPNKVKDAWSKLARPSSEEDKVYGQEENLPITGGEDNYPRWNSARQQHRRVLRGVLAIAFISCCLASFLAGRSFDVRKQCSDSSDGVSTATDISLMARVPVSNVVKSLQMDDAFVRIPQSGESEPEWDSLLPNGLGYIKFPPGAQNMSIVSVFHQLHCLYTIRRAYFAETIGSEELEDFDFGHNRTEHVTHCLEYLRQSLLCVADSTVEPAREKSDRSHALTGRDGPRRCRNFDALRRWTEERRMFNAYGFLAKHDRTQVNQHED